MKKKIIGLAIFALITFGTSFAQLPPHPNGGNDPGPGNTPVGGGASLGGGLIILASLGMGYTMRKIYAFRNENREKLMS